MPSRKSIGNSYTDLGHTSMRRLSSIASLHQLLPFARNRRSDHGSDIVTDSSGIGSSVFTSSTSTVSSLIQVAKDTNETKSSPGEAMHGDMNESSHGIAAASMPRSRTFSNLPLPMRSKKQKLPSLEQSSLIDPGSLRHAIPAGLARSHLLFGHRSSRHATSGSSQPHLKRSDTEPLLSATLDQANSVHRITTFKENLAPCSIRTPVVVGVPEASPDDAKLLAYPYDDFDARVLTEKRSSWKAVPYTPTKGWKKPIEDMDDDKTPTQKSYLAATAPVVKYRHALNDISNIRQASKEEEEAFAKLSTRIDNRAARSEGDGLENTARSPQPHRYVLEAQPMAYWSGRLTSMLDRYQTQELTANFGSPGTMVRRSETDKLFASAASIARTRRAFEELYALCASDIAKESFIKFQLQYAAIHNEAELAKPVGPRSARAKAYLTGSGKSAKTLPENTPPQSGSSGRKPSFVDRLLGRSKRNSLA